MSDNFSSEGDSQKEGDVISKVETSSCGEWVYMGGKKLKREDLITAFGGTLNVETREKPKYGFNASPWGLASFGLTSFIQGLYTVNAKGIHTPNVVLGCVLFYAGIAQFLSGIFCFFERNTFATCSFISYGAFWLLFAAIYIPSFGIMAAYAKHLDQLETGIGFLLIGWSIFSLMLVLCTLKSTLSLLALFVSIFLTFLLQGIGYIASNQNCVKAGGAFGIVVGILGWYNAWAGTANKYNSYFTWKVVPLSAHPYH